ncbi:hypothetical protein BDQ17DRAFT_1359489, partial [Cyathus striatus]
MLDARSPTQEDTILEEEKDASSGPQRSKYNATLSESIKEKRKRSRVTPEQLSDLEAIFATDRSPTAARRREISDLLGMQERQTQIWFQNRRAKAKLQDCRPGNGRTFEPPPETPPELSAGFQVDLHNLIHESEPVTIIPCTELTIGSWRRIASTIAKYDLVAYVSNSKRCLTWYIQSGGYGFKMVLPFEKIMDTKFRNASPGCGTATFMLSEPPLFFAENASPMDSDNLIRTWKRCGDWTEARQATLVLQHTLVGSAVQLSHVLQNLQGNVAAEVPLSSPLYASDATQHLSTLRVYSASGMSSPGESGSDGELVLCSPVNGISPERSIPPVIRYRTATGTSTSFDYCSGHGKVSDYHVLPSTMPRLYSPLLVSQEPDKLISYADQNSSIAYAHRPSPSLPPTPVLSTPYYPPGSIPEPGSIGRLGSDRSPIVAGPTSTPGVNVRYFNHGQLYR